MGLLERLNIGSGLVATAVEQSLEGRAKITNNISEVAEYILSAVEANIVFNAGVLTRNQIFEIVCLTESANDTWKPTNKVDFVEA